MTKTHIARYACQMSLRISRPDSYRVQLESVYHGTSGIKWARFLDSAALNAADVVHVNSLPVSARSTWVPVLPVFCVRDRSGFTTVSR